MNCPYCQSVLPDGQAGVCPSCGRELKAPPPIGVAPALAPVRINWLLFFAVLLAPPLLSLVVARGGRDTEGLAIGTALLGGGVAGLICGVWLGRCLGRTIE